MFTLASKLLILFLFTRLHLIRRQRHESTSETYTMIYALGIVAQHNCSIENKGSSLHPGSAAHGASTPGRPLIPNLVTLRTLNTIHYDLLKFNKFRTKKVLFLPLSQARQVFARRHSQVDTGSCCTHVFPCHCCRKQPQVRSSHKHAGVCGKKQ